MLNNILTNTGFARFPSNNFKHFYSGLTANRINLPNASELYLAFDWASRSPRPALGYRPLLALSPRFSAWRVISLERDDWRHSVSISNRQAANE
jgi:hypothetical protein